MGGVIAAVVLHLGVGVSAVKASAYASAFFLCRAFSWILDLVL